VCFPLDFETLEEFHRHLKTNHAVSSTNTGGSGRSTKSTSTSAFGRNRRRRKRSRLSQYDQFISNKNVKFVGKLSAAKSNTIKLISKFRKGNISEMFSNFEKNQNLIS
jgi:hypothetical protein